MVSEVSTGMEVIRKVDGAGEVKALGVNTVSTLLNI
jgi:hypothetical protein